MLYEKHPIACSMRSVFIKMYNYSGGIMSAIESQINSLTIVYTTVYPGADHRKHQSSASLAFVQGIHRWLVNSPHKGTVTRKMFPFDDVIMSFPIHDKGHALDLVLTDVWHPQYISGTGPSLLNCVQSDIYLLYFTHWGLVTPFGDLQNTDPLVLFQAGF